MENKSIISIKDLGDGKYEVKQKCSQCGEEFTLVVDAETKKELEDIVLSFCGESCRDLYFRQQTSTTTTTAANADKNAEAQDIAKKALGS